MSSYVNREERYPSRRNNVRDRLSPYEYKNPSRRPGDNRWPQSGSRYSRSYAPYAYKNPQTWTPRIEHGEYGRGSGSVNGEPLKLDSLESSCSADTHILKMDAEESVKGEASRGSGRKIASTIITPSRLKDPNDLLFVTRVNLVLLLSPLWRKKYTRRTWEGKNHRCIARYGYWRSRDCNGTTTGFSYGMKC